MPLCKALRTQSLDDLREATEIKVSKQQRLGALGTRGYRRSELPRDALTVDGHCLYKVKSTGRRTCRIAAMGDRLPPKPSSETFASVVSDSAKFFSIALMQAHTESRGEQLYISDADVVGGFLHIPLNSPVPMFLRLPVDLPHPWMVSTCRSFMLCMVCVRVIVYSV